MFLYKWIKFIKQPILQNHMKINLITSNLGKVKEFRIILGTIIEINHIEKEYRELRDDNPEEIAKESAKRLAEELKIPVVVEDSGLFIKSLKGFPGTCSKYIHQRIGLKGILKLMENIEDRSCTYRSAVAYCEHGKEPISFLGEEEGKISKEVKGNHGFGHDPIFIPKGLEKSFGEMEDCESLKKFRKFAVFKLRDYLQNKVN
jgi:XTP/dITP diphosphohydrolase